MKCERCFEQSSVATFFFIITAVRANRSVTAAQLLLLVFLCVVSVIARRIRFKLIIITIRLTDFPIVDLRSDFSN